jgi:hypothetical protein
MRYKYKSWRYNIEICAVRFEEWIAEKGGEGD